MPYLTGLIAFLLIALALSAPAGAGTQCDTAPRLIPVPAQCDLGLPCRLEIQLESGGAAIASVAAMVQAGQALACASPCQPGPAAAGAFCSINPGACRFNVADLAPPISAFEDGQVASLEVVCEEPGEHTIALAEASFGSTAGFTIDGCGASAALHCFAGTTTTTLPAPMCGDATGDGLLTASDALWSLMAAVGTMPCSNAVCDVDCNGSSSATDALIILKAAVGQAVALSCTCAS